ncbi:MAG: isoprenylcysteine carboxylmethyltransferase family protein [Tenuifilaceae bacterium]
MNNLLRHILGYSIGISIFGLLIPFQLIELSRIDTIINIDINDYQFIRLIISVPFFTVGIIFMIWSNFFLFHIGKGGPADGFNFAVSPRTKKLVVTGPYRYTRNPMVFGAFCVYLSIGLYLFSIFCIITLSIFLWLVVYYLKATEEKRLLQDFGDDFLFYKNKTPMIFPNILS